MGSSLYDLFMLTTLLLILISLFHTSSVTSFNSSRCHHDESFAMLQFKESFIIDKNAPRCTAAVESWNKLHEGAIDCCSWDGVECDTVTGHVIGLDLSNSCLFGSINSSSSLFRLLHLRSLNLAFNNFNYSQIPSRLGHLPMLAYLDLSHSLFSGKFPSSLRNLTQLEFISLSGNLFSGQNASDSLSWISELTKLTSLDLENANIYGDICPNLFANMTQLSFLSLYWNQLTGPIPSSLMNLTQLSVLDLSFNKLQGNVPKSISGLKNLEVLNLYTNEFSGLILSSLMNLTQLTILDLSYNEFQGTIPTSSISKFDDLEALGLYSNNFSGQVELDTLLKLRKLSLLTLSLNKGLSLIVNRSSNHATLQKFSVIALGSCNLTEFPNFLRYQDKLQILDLSLNNIHGKIPEWLWNTSKNTLEAIDLSFNYLTGFEVETEVFPWAKTRAIEFRSNLLETPLPLPPPNTEMYSFSSNKLFGEISPLFCNLTSLVVLDVHDNNLTGKLPSCLGNFSDNLQVLDTGRNDFHGIISQTFTRGCELKRIALNHNQLRGEVPRSLAYCTALEFLDFGDNYIDDVFPSWLGALPMLKVLILRSNHLHGALKGRHGKRIIEFPKLSIIDLSQNNFTGKLPIDYLLKWVAMKVAERDQSLSYLLATMKFDSTDYTFERNFTYSMTITNKGTQLNYPKILNFFTAIDLSCNNFEGEIPRVIGSLEGLRLLNLSNNNLRGLIPSSLGNLTDLESLDLSQNNLSGEIPEQLALQLNFLSVFNVSDNQLTGPIPQGRQFDTFQNDAYEGNSGLCGKPLSRKCGGDPEPPSHLSSGDDGQDSSSSFEFGWRPVVIGYGCGMIIGLVIGRIVAIRKHEWLMKTFRIRRPQRMRRRRGVPTSVR